ncbi:unnamed protein product [Cylicocyclus nassatus]|uniref:Uncharacterized protein n=1 Tax=Cylicocyclus nassatus TaxID=53992 RepID=A0AA36H1S2_CYLNA|nr:unnamed protein product [Cylicocyclus nassatus]
MCEVMDSKSHSGDKPVPLSALFGKMIAFDSSEHSSTKFSSLSTECPEMAVDVDVKPSCSNCVVGKLEIPPPPTPIRSSSTCQVCTADGATLHYGGLVCGGCKIFFARAVQRKIYYVCEKSGSCRMISGKRSKCRSCRFQRCLKARMCPEEVGKLRDLKLPDHIVIPAKEESSVVPYFDLAAFRCQQNETFQNVKNPLLERFGTAEGVKYLTRMLVNLERSCDNNAYASSVPESYFCSLDVSLQQALRNPLLVCERTPIIWYHSKALNGPTNAVKPLYCRLLLHYMEWLCAVDDFMALDERYRERLMASHLMTTFLLTVSFNAFKQNTNDLPLGSGFFVPTGSCCLKKYGIDVSLVVDEVQRAIVGKFRELNVCEEEYALLKLIFLFTNIDALDEKVATTMRRIRNKYTYLLVEYLKTSRKCQSAEKAYNRLQELLQIFDQLISIAEIAELLLIHIVALDIDGMRGQLTFDLHLREESE